MSRFKYIYSYQESILVLFLSSILVALFIPGKAVQSILLISFIVYGLVQWYVVPEIYFKRNYVLWLLMLYYIFLLITGIWSEDKLSFLEKLRIKSTLLGLPFVFCLYPHISPVGLKKWTYVLIGLILISIMIVGFNFIISHEEILLNMLKGQPIPVPFSNHIRYNLVVNIGLLLALFFTDRKYHQYRHEYFKWLFIAGILFLYIQFLAVKTGMLISWLILILFISMKVLARKKITWRLSLFMLGTILAICALIQLPTVKNKMAYLKYDLERFQNADFKDYSDGGRIHSIKSGIEIIKGNLLMGVGEGAALAQLTKRGYTFSLIPHNQFILTWAQNGLFGLLLLLLFFACSIVIALQRRNLPLLILTFCLFLACMTESMLETQLGVVIFVLPYCVFYSLPSSDSF